MKVRCTQLLDALGRQASQSAWLTVGDVYHVLSVVLDANRRWMLRLAGDTEPGVGLFPLRQFEIVSSTIPGSWIVTWSDDGVFELTPEAWTEPGFWERYFEHDAAAQRSFDVESRRIVEAEP
jgi:hypothetical protein